MSAMDVARCYKLKVHEITDGSSILGVGGNIFWNKEKDGQLGLLHEVAHWILLTKKLTSFCKTDYGLLKYKQSPELLEDRYQAKLKQLILAEEQLAWDLTYDICQLPEVDVVWNPEVAIRSIQSYM